MRNSATRGNTSHQQSSSPISSETLLIDVDAVARLLNVSSRTVWTLTSTGQLPHLRIGRRVLYSVASIRAWTEAKLTAGPTTPVVAPPAAKPVAKQANAPQSLFGGD
jgi:excisionase family DNA binding protein